MVRLSFIKTTVVVLRLLLVQEKGGERAALKFARERERRGGESGGSCVVGQQ